MALSTLTFKEFDAQVRSEAGALNYADPPDTAIMRWTNIALKKIARLTQPVDSPWGRNTTSVTRLIGTGYGHDPGDGGAFTSATLTFSSLTGLNQTYVGGWVFWNDRSNNRAFWGIIDEVNVAGTTFTVRTYKGTGAVADIASANLFFLAKPNPSFFDGVNLSSVAFMEIVKIVDGTNGIAARLDGDSFFGAWSGDNPNYANSIFFQYAGNALYAGKGSGISAFGTLTATFEEKPTTITATSDALDIRPEHIGVLKDEVVRWVLNYVGNTDKVKAIGDPLESIKQKYRKKAEERVIKQLKVDANQRRM